MRNVKLKIFMVLLMVSVTVFAAESPTKMLEATANQMIDALKENRSSIKQNPKIVENLARKILLPRVDITIMARLALGRDGWNNATTQQRKDFTDEFTILMIRTYASAFAAYRDEQVKFYPIRGGYENQDRVQVKSVIIQQGGPSIPVNYRLLLRGNEWKVYDINVDGVSMVESFRSQFANEISQGGIDGLITALRKHNMGNKA